MTPKYRFPISLMTIMLSLLVAQPAWAIHPPQPQSGGTFFRAKGTKATDAYLEANRPGYVRSFQDHHYGQGLTAGNLNVSPYIAYTREWDNNVFLSDGGRREDWINRLEWGVDGEMPFQEGQHVLRAGVQSLSEWFNRFDSQNHTDWVFQGGGDFNFNHFSLSIFEEFRRTVDRAGTELTARLDRKENYLVGILTIPFGQFFAETEVSHFNLDFRNPAFRALDRYEFQVFPRLGFNVGDRTQMLVEYGFNHIGYEIIEDRNGDSHQASLGLRGLLGEGDLITYQIWGGWEIRNYDSGAREDFSGFIARGNLVYAPTQKTRLMLNAQRRPVESISAGQSYYVRNEISARWRQEIFENFFTNLQGGFRLHNYSDSRTDFYWEPTVGVEYVLPGRIAAIYTEYRFTQRASDASGFDYHRTLWNFGVRAEI